MGSTTGEYSTHAISGNILIRMESMKVTATAFLLIILSTSTTAQACGNLCNMEWLSNASQVEVNEAISGANVHARGEDGDTALMWLARLGTFEDVVALLSAGADVNARTVDGTTVLMASASRYNTDKPLKAILKAGANVHARNERGWTALMEASASGSPENVGVLLNAGAKINARDASGWTALMAASASITPREKITVLLDAGADAKLRDQNGKTAFDYAQSNTKLAGTKVYWRLAVEAGVGLPALISASATGTREDVLALLEAGADANARDETGKTALMAAAASGTRENVIALLKFGADAKLRDTNEKTAFEYAKDNDRLKGTDVYWRLNDERFD